MSLLLADNTANITVKYGQFNRELTKFHYLPVLISDNGDPDLTSTNTLVIGVCKCNEKGNFTFCEERAKQVGVSIQALVAIFICIFTIIGEYLIFGMFSSLQCEDCFVLSLAEIYKSFVAMKWSRSQTCCTYLISRALPLWPARTASVAKLHTPLDRLFHTCIYT